MNGILSRPGLQYPDNHRICLLTLAVLCLFGAVVFKLCSVEHWGSEIGHQGFFKETGRNSGAGQEAVHCHCRTGHLALCQFTQPMELGAGVPRQKKRYERVPSLTSGSLKSTGLDYK